MPTFPKGLSAEEMLRALSTPDELEALDQFKNFAIAPLITFGDPSHYDVMHSRWSALHRPLELRVLERLREGTLLVTGIEVPLSARSTRELIAPELWEILELWFEHNHATGEGLKLMKLELLEPHELEAPAQSGTVNPRAFLASAAEFALSEDDRLLTVKGETLILRGPVQRAIMRLLYDAFLTGKSLRTETLLRHAGSEVDTVSKAFSGSPNWPHLKQVVVSRGGFTWLEP